MEAYWNEVKSIEEEDDPDDDDRRDSLDEAELEEAWLREAGLSSLVTVSSLGEGPEALLSTLTRQQVATVKKKLDSYQQTLKMKNRQPIRDVRDVFNMAIDTATDKPPSPPPRKHKTTRTIHHRRVRPSFPSFSQHENNVPEEHTQSPTHTHTDTPTITDSVSVSPSLRADWLVSDLPYSESVTETKGGGACQHLHYDNTNFPQYELPFPRQGITTIDDLSTCDVIKLRHIGLIEVSTLLNALGVQSKRTRTHRTKARVSMCLQPDSGVFGVPLISLLEHDRKRFPGEKVPVVFSKMLSILEQTGLQTEGILRVPCSAARLKFLREELDRKWALGGFDWSAVRQQEAAGLLKLFIRELPDALLTSQHTHIYSAVHGLSSLHQLQMLNLLIILLPEDNRHTLKALLGFLRKVVDQQHHNRMSACNVAMVMAPNLFACRHRGNRRSVARQQEEMQEAVNRAHLVAQMISYQEVLWTIPCFLLSQVRQMNEASRRRGRPWKREPHTQNQVTDLFEGVIRVHAPLHTKISMAIQLDGQMTASDVISRFQFDNRGPSKSSQCLFEVGGNIGQRYLHPDTILMDVYHINPQCEWILKPRHS